MISSFMLVNLFEIKALVLGLLTKPIVIAHAPERTRAQLARMFDSVILDEARHIAYSSDVLADGFSRGHEPMIRLAMADFQSTLNQVTENELKAESSVESQEWAVS